jgi:predicted Zn-dependent protease
MRWRRAARGRRCRGRSSSSTPTASNAFAAPGGYVHITRGALALIKNEAELAGVLSHEIIHVTEKHTVRAIQKSQACRWAPRKRCPGNSALMQTAVTATYDNIVDKGFGRPMKTSRRKGAAARQQDRLRAKRPGRS